MKRTLLYVPIILLILFASCFQPESHEGIPDWVNDFIDVIEADTSHTPEYGIGEIWQYEYKGDIVYYMVSAWNDAYNYLYNAEGDLLGCPDGGWTGSGDGSYSDFPSERMNGVLFWKNGTAANLDDSQDHDIINAVLDHLFPDSSFIHVFMESGGHCNTENIAMHLNNKEWDFDYFTLSSLTLKNSEAHVWDENELISTVELISQETYSDIIQQNGWEGYLLTYPQSVRLMNFSRPGLDPEGNHAILEMGITTGASSSSGYAVLLEKVDGSWQFQSYTKIWLS